MSNSKFTRGPATVKSDPPLHAGCVWVGTQPIASVHFNGDKGSDNSELIAAAFNAATACEVLGFNGIAAVRALPELLNALKLCKCTLNARGGHTAAERDAAIDSALSALTPHPIKAYHFTGSTLRDGRPIPPVGEWLDHTGPLVPCRSGLHASEHPFDALVYAPGSLLHLVELDGETILHSEPVNKVVARRRRIIATINAESLLREFARWCALQVIHLWNTPTIVRQYLETGDESIKSAAKSAAWSAAKSAAESAAWSAAKNAAESAAWSAAESAAWSAAWSAAESAAESAAWSAAWSAAESAAWSAQRDKFQQLVDSAFSSLPQSQHSNSSADSSPA